MSTINNEIPAVDFEHELQEGAAVAVLDVRSGDSAQRWPLDAGDAPIAAVPRADLASFGRAAIAELANGRSLRVICTRGNNSSTVVTELASLGIESRSVSGGMVAWARLLTADEIDVGTTTKVVQFRREARGCLSYLIADGSDALVVDPAPATDAYLESAERLGVRLAGILDTHIHADHLSGARTLAAATGAKLHLSRWAFQRGVRYWSDVTPVADGDRIGPPGADVRIIELPGHTTDNVGVMIDGRALIAGDSLFCDAVARPELEVGAERAEDAARVLHRTLHDRVLSLPDYTLLLPCHYPGGRLSEPNLTTIGEARKRVQLASLSRESFVEAVLAEMPPRPANHETIIAVNLGIDDPPDAELLEVGANNCAAGPGSSG